MKSLHPLFAVGVLLLGTNALPAKITRTVEKTFAVKPGGSLKTSTQGGDITIHTADIAEVRIQARQVFRVSTEAEADEIAGQLELTLEQNGDQVTAESRYPGKRKASWFGNRLPVTVSFAITLPSRYNLNLATSGGDITVESLTGDVRARTSGGDLRFARVDGVIDAATSGGDITLAEGTAKAKLHTSGGDIHVDRAGGPTEVSTSGGDIRLKSVAQLIRASTSGGDVSAIITEPLAQDALISTSGGQVRVEIVKDARYQLDARTSGGSVTATGITITLEGGEAGRSRLAGAVNGGGPVLKLRSSGGDIRLRSF